MKVNLVGMALLSVVSLATSALAGGEGLKDSATGAAADWTGYYIGGFAGGAWGDSSVLTDIGAVTGTSYISSVPNAAAIENDGSGSLTDSLFTGGFLVGGTRQSGQWVYGAELDFGSFSFNATGGASDVYPTFAATYNVRTAVETDWLMTARGRLGWLASDRLLVYVTGGLALTDVEVRNSFSDNAGSSGVGGSTKSDTKAGWVIGGGIELALHENWTLRGEYLHVDFGDVTTSSSIGCGPSVAAICSAPPLNLTPSSFRTRADLSADIARAALTLRF